MRTSIWYLTFSAVVALTSFFALPGCESDEHERREGRPEWREDRGEEHGGWRDERREELRERHDHDYDCLGRAE